MATENSFKAAAEAKRRAQEAREKAEKEAAEKAAQKAEGQGAEENGAETPSEAPVAPVAVVQTETVEPEAEEIKDEDSENPELKSAREAIASAYAAKIKGKIEPQKERIQVATTKTIKDQLKALEKEKKIKSMNHLINSLLKMYLGMEDD